VLKLQDWTLMDQAVNNTGQENDGQDEDGLVAGSSQYEEK